MSGGRWNYDQHKIQDIGNRLSEENHIVLKALGTHLISIADEMHAADRFLSCDTSEYDFSKMAALLPKEVFFREYLGLIQRTNKSLEILMDIVKPMAGGGAPP